ncbi:unnamed protein product [Closterium sp. Naga37s-1]|nr:unnamed protein product [Closterium sp. Naga37s-1]
MGVNGFCGAAAAAAAHPPHPPSLPPSPVPSTYPPSHPPSPFPFPSPILSPFPASPFPYPISLSLPPYLSPFSASPFPSPRPLSIPHLPLPSRIPISFRVSLSLPPSPFPSPHPLSLTPSPSTFPHSSLPSPHPPFPSPISVSFPAISLSLPTTPFPFPIPLSLPPSPFHSASPFPFPHPLSLPRIPLPFPQASLPSSLDRTHGKEEGTSQDIPNSSVKRREWRWGGGCTSSAPLLCFVTKPAGPPLRLYLPPSAAPTAAAVSARRLVRPAHPRPPHQIAHLAPPPLSALSPLRTTVGGEGVGGRVGGKV